MRLATDPPFCFKMLDVNVDVDVIKCFRILVSISRDSTTYNAVDISQRFKMAAVYRKFKFLSFSSSKI